MNCEEAIRLIHLRGDEEMSAQEGEKLRAHILSCEGCAQESLLVRRTEHALHRLRASVPVLARPEDLTRSILAGIAKASTSRTRPRGFLETLLTLFARPAFRFVYATIVLAFASLFVFQQADTFRSVEALSAKLARERQPLAADVRYSMTLEEVRGIAGTAELEPFIAGAPVSVSDDRISVRKSDIESWAPSLGSRLASKMFASSDTPIERLPSLILDIQKSVTSSLTLRSGGKDQ